MTTTTNQLKGKELLDYIDANKELPKSELVKGAGYVRFDEEGKMSLSMTEFYQEMLDAKQINIGSVEPTEPKELGEKTTYTINIPVQCCVTVTVEGKVGMTKEQIADSITRQDLANCEGEMTWDDIKDAWRSFDVDCYSVYDENGNDIED
jgi:hypothetical protein